MWRREDTKCGEIIEQYVLPKVVRVHNERVQNVGRKVVNSFYKNRAAPRVKPYNIDERVRGVTGVRKFM